MRCKKVKCYSDGSISVFENPASFINISSWESGCHIFTSYDKCENNHKGSFDYSIFKLAPLLDPDYHSSPISRFCNSIPREIVQKISKFQYRQLKMLNVVANNKAAQDLLESSPVLFWIYVDWIKKNDMPKPRVSEVLLEKHISILRLIYPDANKTHLKFINSLLLNKYDKSILNLIFKVFFNNIILFQLRHIKIINYGIIGFLLKMNFEDDFEIKVIILILKRYQNVKGMSVTGLLHLYEDTLKMNQVIYHSYEHPLINENILTIEKLYLSHKILDCKINAPNYIEDIKQTLLLNEMAGENHEHDAFPKAYIVGNENITHITTYAELVSEGLEMNTCVLNYSQQIKNGESCLYKVIRPERGTLELKKKNGGLYISQFSLKENDEPNVNSFVYINKWLKGYKL